MARAASLLLLLVGGAVVLVAVAPELLDGIVVTLQRLLSWLRELVGTAGTAS